MNGVSGPRGWLPDFRRSVELLKPHGRYLIIGLLAAIGVSVTYTFSISSIIPVLKVLFAEHETLADWVHRIETERRLDVALPADVPDDPAGLRILSVQPDSRSGTLLRPGDRIASIGGQALSSYDVLKKLAEHRAPTLQDVVLIQNGEPPRTVQLTLRAYHWWSRNFVAIAGYLPRGKDPDSRLATLATVIGALVVIATVGGVFRFLNEGLVAIAVQRAMHDLRSRLAEHVMRLPLDWHSRQPPGDTLGRFATDISKVEVGITTLFGKTIREPLKAVGVLTLTMLIEWQLLIVALIGLPIGIITIRTFGRMVKRAQKKASASWGRLLDHLGERLAGIRIVKAYNMERAEARRFQSEDRALTSAQTHIELVDAATNPVLETLAVLGVAGFVLYGGARVFSDQLEPHLFFAAVVCLGGIFDPVRKMGNVNNRLQQADVSARRLFELLDTPAERVPALPQRSRRPLSVEHSIEFDSVSFSYPSAPQRPVLHDVSFQVRVGETIALVGPNGCGKTTLVSLLLRFYEPTSGRILIDGQDIANVALAELRAKIGLVTQDAVIFSDTIFANMTYGADDSDTRSVMSAAQLAHVDDFIRTLASEEEGATHGGLSATINARELSGGQRQRIALARAIYRDPPILVLDEATSQVDTESERKIQEALEDVTRGRTTFIIAHRFSTIARADRVVVLNEGRVVGIGQHADLIGSSAFYNALCETQFGSGTLAPH